MKIKVPGGADIEHNGPAPVKQVLEGADRKLLRRFVAARRDVVLQRRAPERERVDPPVREEVTVLDGEQRVDQHLGDLLALHQGAVLVQLPDGRVVGRGQTGEQVRGIRGVEHLLHGAQHLRQRFRAQLGCSTGAVRESGQANLATGRSLVGFAHEGPRKIGVSALTCFSSTFSIRIPKVSTTVSVSETFLFLAALLYGPAVATIVVAVDGLMIAFWRRYRRVPQVLFNMAGPALSIWIASLAYELIAGHRIGDTHATALPAVIVVLSNWIDTGPWSWNLPATRGQCAFFIWKLMVAYHGAGGAGSAD